MNSNIKNYQNLLSFFFSKNKINCLMNVFTASNSFLEFDT